MFSKKLVLIAALVFVASLFFSGFMLIDLERLEAVDRNWEYIISLYLFSFLLLLYFIPNIKTIKKSLAYCMLIPFIFCGFLSMTVILLRYTMSIDMPLHARNIDNIFNIIEILIFLSGAALYFFCFGWLASISLMIVFSVHLYLRKSNKRSLEKTPFLSLPSHQSKLPYSKPFGRNKFSFIVGLVYIMFIALYGYLYENLRWSGSRMRMFSDIIPICLLSMFSIFYFLPMVLGRMKKLMACCIFLPMFWSVFVRIIYAILICVYTYVFGVEHFKSDIFSVGFYLDYYIKARAWFISLLLVFVCVIYYYFLKGETAKKVQENVR